MVILSNLDPHGQQKHQLPGSWKVNLLQNCHVAAARIGGGDGWSVWSRKTKGVKGDRMCVVGGGKA